MKQQQRERFIHNFAETWKQSSKKGKWREKEKKLTQKNPFHALFTHCFPPTIASAFTRFDRTF